MAVIRQGQTAHFNINTDITSADAVRATIKYKGGSKTIDIEESIGGVIQIDLSQEDTLSMPEGQFEMQLKAKLGDEVQVSNIMTGTVLKSLDESVME